MPRRRRRQEEQSEGNERWLITYADMITLLLVFFIVLYSMSEVKNEQFNALIQSLQTAFTGDSTINQSENPPGMNFNMPPIVPEKPKEEVSEQKLDELYVKLMNYIKENGLTEEVILKNLPRGIQISFKDKILFDLGSAMIKDKAEPILHQVAKILKTVKHEVSIEGHTDNNPIVSGGKFESNWELSGARARHVVLYFIKKEGLHRDRLSFTGYGEYAPIVPNDTKVHQQMNRRVNIVVLREEKAPESKIKIENQS